MNRFDKLLLITTVIFVILGLINVPKHFNYSELKPSDYPSYIGDSEPIPDEIYKLSKKYNLYPEIYNSQKPIFVYGYNTHTMDEIQGSIFHEDLTKKLKKAKNINYEVFSYKNFNEEQDKLLEKITPGSSGCTMLEANGESAKEVTSFTSKCLMNSCIIDAKGKVFYKVSRNPEFAAKILAKPYSEISR